MNKRFKNKPEKPELNLRELEAPLHLRKPAVIGVQFMGDLFHESVPFEWIDKVVRMVAFHPQHSFLLLTKRPERMLEYSDSIENLEIESERDMALWDAWRAVYGSELNQTQWPLKNLWLGVTCENQKAADERIPILLQIPAAKRWISYEPLLEEINPFHLWGTKHLPYEPGQISHVVIGCESGPKRRPCKLEWVRSIVGQCRTAGVACFVKQIEVNEKVNHDTSEWPEDLRVQERL
jgi:protein gp37